MHDITALRLFILDVNPSCIVRVIIILVYADVLRGPGPAIRFAPEQSQRAAGRPARQVDYLLDDRCEFGAVIPGVKHPR